MVPNWTSKYVAHRDTIRDLWSDQLGDRHKKYLPILSPYRSFWPFGQKEYLYTKAQLWRFLINKLVSVTPLTNNTLRKLTSAFQQYQGLGVADGVFITKYYLAQNGWGCNYSRFWGARQKDCLFENKQSRAKSYVGATINHPRIPPENTPNMASEADDSDLPSLSSPVPPCGNDGQRYSDGLPHLFAGQNRPLAAAATGKHRHDVSTMRRAFT